MRLSKHFNFALSSGAWLSICVLVLIAAFLVLKSLPFVFEQGLSRIWQDDYWQPLSGQFNLLPMLVGSLLVTLGAVALAGPVGILLAIFGRFYAPAGIRGTFRAIMELLSGIPSVVYGFWGLLILVPLINRWVPPGASVLAGCLVLALMILPLVVLVTDAAISQLPKRWLAAADALAIKRWSLIYKVILPAVRPSILTGLFLQTGRALGETMAVLMVCGNIVQIPGNPFEPARTLTANIALEMAYAVDAHADALFVSGLLLFVVTILLVSISSRITRTARTDGGASCE